MAIFPPQQKLEIFTHREGEGGGRNHKSNNLLLNSQNCYLLISNLAAQQEEEKVKWWVRKRNGNAMHNLFSSLKINYDV